MSKLSENQIFRNTMRPITKLSLTQTTIHGKLYSIFRLVRHSKLHNLIQRPQKHWKLKIRFSKIFLWWFISYIFEGEKHDATN